MDKTEARAILDEHLARFSRRAFSELVPLVEARHVETFEVVGSSGTRYQVEIEFIWDDQPGGVIRILADIDDGGIRAFFPLGRSELVSPPEGIRA
jgi:hypothetical protein